VTNRRFKELDSAEALAEQAEVFGHRYGTPRSLLEDRLRQGLDTLLVLDWQGRRSLARNYPDALVSVFLLPPSLQELELRLRQRGQDTGPTMARRLAEAPAELGFCQEYNYCLRSDHAEHSLWQLQTILFHERSRREHAQAAG